VQKKAKGGTEFERPETFLKGTPKGSGEMAYSTPQNKRESALPNHIGDSVSKGKKLPQEHRPREETTEMQPLRMADQKNFLNSRQKYEGKACTAVPGAKTFRKREKIRTGGGGGKGKKKKGSGDARILVYERLQNLWPRK